MEAIDLAGYNSSCVQVVQKGLATAKKLAVGGDGSQTKSPKPVAGKPVAERFADIQANAWYIRDVQYAVDSGLMQGTGSGYGRHDRGNDGRAEDTKGELNRAV